MKHTVCILLLLPVFINACNNTEKENTKEPDTYVNKPVKKTKPPSSLSDSLLIEEPAAIFFHPDSLQDVKIKALTDSGIYKSYTHEMFYQMRYAGIVLHTYYPGLKRIEVKDIRYLVIRKKNSKTEIIDLNTYDDSSGLLVTDLVQPVRLLDMTNIETELDFYFKKNIPGK